MLAPGSMSISPGYPLTNPRVTKSPLFEGLNDSSSESDPALDLTGLSPARYLLGSFNKILGIRFISLVSGS